MQQQPPLTAPYPLFAEMLGSLSEEAKKALSAGITQESIESLILISSQGTREDLNVALRKESHLTDEQLKEFDGMSQTKIMTVLAGILAAVGSGTVGGANA